MSRHSVLVALALWLVSSSLAQAFPVPQRMHPSFQPHYGCFGYCPGPLRPSHQPYWGCFGYCPGPLNPHPQPHWGCFGYCPGPLPGPYNYPTYSYMPDVYAPTYGGDVNYVAPQINPTPPPTSIPSAQPAPPKPAPAAPLVPSYEGKTIVQWTELLQSPTARQRGQAAAALATFGTRAAPAVPNLVELLDDSDANVRLQVTLTLAVIGKDALPSLRLALQNENSLIRMGAALTLGHMDAAAAPLGPDLRTALNDPDTAVRCHAAQALWRIDAKANEVLPTLIAALKTSRDHNIRMGVMSTLSQMGDAADPAIDALRELLKNGDDPQLQLAASTTLWNLDHNPAQVTPALSKLLASKVPGIRYDAALALGQLGKAAAAAIPELAKALQDEDATVCQQAAAALSQVGAAAVPALIAAVQQDNVNARRNAVVALGNIGSAAQAAVVVLRTASAHDSDAVVRVLAKSALGEIEPSAVPKE